MQEENSHKDFALLFRRNDYKSLGRVRGLRHASVVRQGDKLWLLVRKADKQTQTLLNRLPAWKRYFMQEGLLIPVGKTVPEDKEPEGMEKTLDDFLEVIMPKSYSPAYNSQKVMLKLEPSHIEVNAKAVMCKAQDFFSYCQQTLAVRYKDLSYVFNGDKVLVQGAPLPPVPGRHYYLRNKLFLPCGYVIKPRISDDLLEKLFSEKSLWEVESGKAVTLPEFEAVSLSSLRSTLGMVK